jgi:hypothetical protein
VRPKKPPVHMDTHPRTPRVLCGRAWRRVTSTTVADAVTCRACLKKLEEIPR